MQRRELVDVAGKDIVSHTNGKCKIIRYSDLSSFQSISELFSKMGVPCLALLYQTKDVNTGHWVALIKQPDKLIVYDSYGFGRLDAELQYTTYDKTALLSQLVAREKEDNPNFSVQVNKKRYQSKNDHISTCGRHTIVRILLYSLNTNQFDRFMESVPIQNKDDMVTLMTISIGT